MPQLHVGMHLADTVQRCQKVHMTYSNVPSVHTALYALHSACAFEEEAPHHQRVTYSVSTAYIQILLSIPGKTCVGIAG